MNKGLTLIELMVTVTVMMLTVGGGVVYLNNFNQSQKVQTTKASLISALSLARDYARTSQLPTGSSGTVHCVMPVFSADLSAATFTTDAGGSYGNSRELADSGVTITYTNAMPCFALFAGKLLSPNVSGVWVPITLTPVFTISSPTSLGVQVTDVLTVNQAGVINEKP